MKNISKTKSFSNKGQSGFTLVEVMIAAAIMGALSLALYQLVADQQKAARKSEVRFEVDAILNEIRQTLGNRDSCVATLAGRNAVATAPGDAAADINRTRHVISPTSTVDKYISNTNFNLATKYGAGAARLLSYSLNSVDATDPTIGMIAGTAFGSTNLLITFRYSVSVPPIVKKMRINVQTVSDTDRTIVTCTSTGDIADYDTRYVDVLGDTMTGDLIMSNNSNIQITGTGTVVMSSDKRLKHNIKSLSNVTETINKLRPVSYQWNENDQVATGLIAQEVQNILPRLVHPRKENDYLTIDYIQLSPYLIRGLQEANQKNLFLEKKVQTLNSELSLIKEHLCQKDPQSAFCANPELER